MMVLENLYFVITSMIVFLYGCNIIAECIRQLTEVFEETEMNE